MLHFYKFKNFLSFKNETAISFKLPKAAPQNNLCFASEVDSRIKLSKVIAAFGPNASGKTNLLKPLAFLSWFVNNSFAHPPEMSLPFKGHFTDAPSEFFIEFELAKNLYQYQLIVDHQKVFKEAFYVKTSSKFSYIFDRTYDSKKNNYHIKQEGFGFNQQEAEKVRTNASLISTAAQYQTPLALKLKEYFAHFISNVGPMGRSPSEQILIQVTRAYENKPEIKKQMLNIMRKIDLGLHDIEFIEESHAVVLNGQPSIQRVLIPYGIHLIHGQKHSVHFQFESNGTRSAFVILFQILYALMTGGIAIIDELEQEFHPDLLEYILNLFFDPSINLKNAQIIFTSHSHQIMNLLDKTQIILVEKDENCISHAWCLNDMQGVRRDENWFAKYRAGAYRAIPNLG